MFTNCDLILGISHEIFNTRTSYHSTPEHQYLCGGHVGKVEIKWGTSIGVTSRE